MLQRYYFHISQYVTKLTYQQINVYPIVKMLTIHYLAIKRVVSKIEYRMYLKLYHRVKLKCLNIQALQCYTP